MRRGRRGGQEFAPLARSPLAQERQPGVRAARRAPVAVRRQRAFAQRGGSRALYHPHEIDGVEAHRGGAGERRNEHARARLPKPPGGRRQRLVQRLAEGVEGRRRVYRLRRRQLVHPHLYLVQRLDFGFGNVQAAGGEFLEGVPRPLAEGVPRAAVRRRLHVVGERFDEGGEVARGARFRPHAGGARRAQLALVRVRLPLQAFRVGVQAALPLRLSARHARLLRYGVPEARNESARRDAGRLHRAAGKPRHHVVPREIADREIHQPRQRAPDGGLRKRRGIRTGDGQSRQFQLFAD